MTQTQREGTVLEPIYNGVGDRVGQTEGGSTTNYALDVAGGLPEVIYTSEGSAYLHLPGVIVTEKAGDVRYLLSDGLGSVRQVVDETGEVVTHQEFDPYGNSVSGPGGEPYGFTGEWWEDEISLLHLRARWYLPEDGVFLSRDQIESEPPYQYVRGNVVNLIDPSGNAPQCQDPKCKLELKSTQIQAGGGWLSWARHLELVVTDPSGVSQVAAGFPENNPFSLDPGSIITIITNPGDNQDALDRERNGANGAIFTTLIEGDLACDKWKCLSKKMVDIHNLERPYQFFSANSNSAVYSALKACSIFVSWSDGINNHPGWGNDLFNVPPRSIWLDPICVNNPELCYTHPA